jgi:small-conductance mechanosensitive channel
VRASYKADPGEVQALLARVAASQHELAAVPAPHASFDNLGEYGLEFSVRGHPAEGLDASIAESALRTARVRAMRESGIEIPHPQTDVHLRDLDAVRSLLTRVAEERFRTVNAGEVKTADSEPTKS